MATDKPKSPDRDSNELLGFERQRMIDWYSPSQLAQTGLRTVISAVFGDYADKREMQAALQLTNEIQPAEDFSDRSSVWIDYVSDIGSGWNSSYSVAYLIGRKKLMVSDSAGKNHLLPRANMLVMGGDEVYPTATWKEYKDRLIAPYRCSLPYVEDSPPTLYAIPGNHDWYDGLSSFIKMFCQQRWIGGWQTKQTRSYFATRLPHDWWLWGIDIQLSADIDKTQIDYFDKIYEQASPGDDIILCTAEPAWTYQEYQLDDKAYRNLRFFQERYSKREDKQLNFRLLLAGDLHHYTSFKKENDPDPDWKITAGGGGAFLHPTHQVPDRLNLETGTFTRSTSFPDEATSRKLAWNNLKFPFINRTFGVFFSVIYFLFAWLTAVSKTAGGDPSSFFHALSALSISQADEALQLYKNLLFYNPEISFLLLIVFAGIVAFADKNRKDNITCWVLGSLHGLFQILLILCSVWITAALLIALFGTIPASSMGIMAGTIIMAILGWLFSGYAMGIYLLVAILLLKTHDTEAFSSFRGEDYKNFIRIKISPKELTIYPVKIPATCRHWQYNAGVEGEHPWYSPEDDLKYDLIEDPIIIRRK